MMQEKDDVLTSIENAEKKNLSVPKKLTVLPLRDIIIFPNMIFPVLIGRTSSLKAVADAVERDKFIFVTAQKNSTVDEPEFDDLFKIGTTAKIIQVLRLPNNLLKVLIEGLYISKIAKKTKNKECLEAEIVPVDIIFKDKDPELQAMIRHTSELFNEYIRINRSLPPEIITAFNNIEDPVRKLYYACANVQTKVDTKQKVLEKSDLKDQFFELTTILSTEIEMLKIEEEIDIKVHDSIQKTQKKYYIQEQIRALQKELGEEEDLIPELASLKEMLEKAQLSPAAKAKADEEFDRLKKTPTMSPEFSVNRTYLELLASLPWSNRSDDNLDIEHVRKILDDDHYALEKPKERILEFIAVLNLAGALRRQILCFVGPPGVGKTSLARSIARGLGRNFVRFSLGGIRDEAEIRGHRRTYIGAMPGKIIQSMKKAGTINPVILLDEVDKMSMDFRGDPSSALLEVLDPEQNVAFNDHYIEVDYDLSNVLFITTANVRYDIPLPLQDRMEIIDLSSYLDPEKFEIAMRHIFPKVLKEFGLENFNIEFKPEALTRLITQYTREAGVRNLEREISSILRKMAKDIVQKFDKQGKTKQENGEEAPRSKALKELPEFINYIKNKKFVIDAKKIEEYLKAPKYKIKKEDLEDKIGVATGLAWTSVGGEILPIEVTMMPGPERLTLTGKLGDVMKESATAALSFVRSNLSLLKIPVDFNRKKEIHIHIPEGAIPKDGPSAGMAMTLALISAASQNPLRGDVAMTGEITLRGNILPIGGLNEKLLAAKKAGIMNVIVPKENERDIEDVNEVIKKDLNISFVRHLSEALPIAFKNNISDKKIINNKNQKEKKIVNTSKSKKRV